MSNRARVSTRMIRETTSFRLPADTLARLDARAATLGTTRTTLAEQFLEEGLRLVEHPGITFTDGAAGRRATIAGTRLDVWMVVEVIRDNGGDLEAAAGYLETPLHRVQAAARYYAAFPAEIDGWSAANEALFEREALLAAEQRRLLG